MAATAQFVEDNGAATATSSSLGGANKGTTRTTGVANVNWKAIDDATTAYHASPITAGTNSYSKFQSVLFTGTFNQIANCLYQHVTGNLGAGLTIKGFVSGSGIYATPTQTTVAAFTYDMSSTGLISTGYSVKVGAGGPEASGKATSTTSNPAWSEYIGTQLQTTVAASAGDSVTNFFQFRWDEN